MDEPPREGREAPRRRRRTVVVVAAAAAVLVAAGIALLVVLARGAAIPPPQSSSAAFVAAWNRRDWAGMAALVDRPPPDFAAVNRTQLADVTATRATFSAGAPLTRRRAGSVPLTATIDVRGLGTWTYSSTLPIRVVGHRWLVEWSPAVINPHLRPGDHLAVGRQLPARAPVLDAQGQPLAHVTGAAALVGDVAPASAAQAAGAGPPWLPGDPVGTFGLEKTYNARLAGAPSGDVAVADAAGRDTLLLHHFPGAAPQPVVTTIDATVQRDADAVLAGVAKPAALVAIDASNGQVRAVVNHPDNGYPRALVGTYPAGSTFKVVTSTAALEAGYTPDTPVTCPPSIDVGGRTFTNAEHEVLGSVTFREAFAKSCNTAFIGVAQKLTDAQLEQAADTYGINTDWPFPVPHFTGKLPPPRSPVEHAADAIGQGLVEVSPLEMCSIAAAVASGTWQAPILVAGAPAGPAHALPAAVADALRLLMRAVVTSGTGTAADLPGDPVFAKTGTAEFGTGNPPATHAWFIGWRDTTAFAVIVEGGGFGGDVAAPLAARFLSRI